MQAATVSTDSRYMRVLDKINDAQMWFENTVFSMARKVVDGELRSLDKEYPNYHFSLEVDKENVRIVAAPPIQVDYYEFRYVSLENVDTMLKYLHNKSTHTSDQKATSHLLERIRGVIVFAKFVLEKYDIPLISG